MEEIDRAGTINALGWLEDEAREEAKSTLRKYYDKKKENTQERELLLKAEISELKLTECKQKSIILSKLYGTIARVQECGDIPWLAKRAAFQAQGILEVAAELTLLDKDWAETLQNYLRHLIQKYSETEKNTAHHAG